MIKAKNIDDYISRYPLQVQKMLQELRGIIKTNAPESVEVISYSMPAFKQNGILVYFAAYDHHIGFYPAPDAVKHFAKDLVKYKTSKAAIQFPLDELIPKDLVGKIVKFRIKEDMALAKKKK